MLGVGRVSIGCVLEGWAAGTSGMQSIMGQTTCQLTFTRWWRVLVQYPRIVMNTLNYAIRSQYKG